jgi:hypothetical protein
VLSAFARFGRIRRKRAGDQLNAAVEIGGEAMDSADESVFPSADHTHS